MPRSCGGHGLTAWEGLKEARVAASQGAEREVEEGSPGEDLEFVPCNRKPREG